MNSNTEINQSIVQITFSSLLFFSKIIKYKKINLLDTTALLKSKRFYIKPYEVIGY